MQARKNEEVSKATHRPADLYDAFFTFISQNEERVDVMESASDELEVLYQLWQHKLLAKVIDMFPEEGTFPHLDLLYDTLWNVMQEFAPKGYYFGSHIGDGSLYGYWEDEDV